MNQESLTNEENIEKIYEILDERGRVLERQGKILESNQHNIQMLIMTLKGNPEYETEGYKDRISRNEDDISKLAEIVSSNEKRFNRIYYKVIGICVGVAFVFSAIGWAVSNEIFDVKPTTDIPEKKAPEPEDLSNAIPPKDLSREFTNEYLKNKDNER